MGQVNIQNQPLSNLRDLILGEPGTFVVLGFQRGAQVLTFCFALPRLAVYETAARDCLVSRLRRVGANVVCSCAPLTSGRPLVQFLEARMMRGTPDFLDKHMSAPNQTSASMQQPTSSMPAPSLVSAPSRAVLAH